ncbi:hypothetical protein LTR53_014349, partial [Teratosphaeriaceae sp. CCFEE 6253]
ALYDPSPLTAPLLSPVAELRTPSPTQTHLFDTQESPRANGLFRAAHIAHAKQASMSSEHAAPMSLQERALHERQGGTPNSVAAGKSAALAKSPTMGMTPGSASREPNPWQQVQAGKKGHKKSKSTATGVPSGRGIGGGGQPLPVNEGERKGG